MILDLTKFRKLEQHNYMWTIHRRTNDLGYMLVLTPPGCDWTMEIVKHFKTLEELVEFPMPYLDGDFADA